MTSPKDSGTILKDPTAMSIKRPILKIAGTALLAALTVLGQRYRNGYPTWSTFFQHLSTPRLIWIIVALPVSWIALEFLDACLSELAKLARDGGKSTASGIVKLPRAIANVAQRGYERVDAFTNKWNFDRRYFRRIYEDYGLVNDRGLGLINAARLDLERVYVELQISNQVAQPRSDLLGNPVHGRQPIWDFLRAMKPGRGLALSSEPPAAVRRRSYSTCCWYSQPESTSAINSPNFSPSS
jgi:hypothetical protein